jgi:hypothetical protein
MSALRDGGSNEWRLTNSAKDQILRIGARWQPIQKVAADVRRLKSSTR